MTGIVAVSLLGQWLAGQAWVGVAGGILGMVVVARRPVKMLAALHADLEQTEQERAALEQALRTSQRMEVLGRLTVGAAHDFNNHLTVISSNVEMLARRLEITQKPLLRHVDAALQAVQRAAALTGRLLSLSRQSMREPEMVDVNRLLGRLADLFRGTLGNRIRLDVVLSHEAWFTWADVNELEHVLLSLVVTVHDQLPDDAKLSVTVSNMRQDHECPSGGRILAGDSIQIAINDGAGMGELGRWRSVTDRSNADLCMACRFAHENGGEILRSDSVADGLSLRVVLPRYLPPVPAARISRRQPGQPPVILVVEDDDLARGSCIEILRQLGYDVLEARDAMEAFRLIADRGGIDLLFTEIGLQGGVNGRVLADAARNVDAEMRVLFSISHEPVNLPNCVRMALLRKPFTPDQLAARIRDLLAGEPSAAAQGLASGD